MFFRLSTEKLSSVVFPVNHSRLPPLSKAKLVWIPDPGKRLLAAAEGSRMDDAFLFKSMFTWYREMTNRDQPVTDETITVAAQAICQQMNESHEKITGDWVSKFKDRYGIRTGSATDRVPAAWRPRGAARRKLSDPAPSQELIDKRARLGKSYAIDEESDQEKEEKRDSDDSLCGFSFEELSSVPEYKPFCCEHCSERYLWGHQLKEHMKCHSDVRKYLCTSCGKNYKSPHNLKIHMRVHTGDRPYVCSTCGKGFREHSALVKHKRIHTGERPFLCSDCGSAFISKTQLNIHVKTHQSESRGRGGGVSEKRRKFRASSRATPVATSADLTRDQPPTGCNTATSEPPGDSPTTSVPGTPATPGTPGSQTQALPPMNHLLPGTGYYIPITTSGSISSGTPMLSASQYASRMMDASSGRYPPLQPPGSEPEQQQQQHMQMAQDFMQTAAAAQAYYEDYYYGT